MVDALALSLLALSLIVGAWLLAMGRLNRSPSPPYFLALGLVELGLLVQVVVAVIRLIGGERPDELATFIGYLVAVLVVLPLAAAWGRMDHSKWGTVVLGAGCLVIAVLILRLRQLWTPDG